MFPRVCGRRPPYGAGHGQEVPFVYGNAEHALHSVTPAGAAASTATPTATDLAVAARMNGCWAAFARTGVPCSGIVAWPRYGAGGQSMTFGAEPRVEVHYRQAALDYQEARVQQMMARTPRP